MTAKEFYDAWDGTEDNSYLAFHLGDVFIKLKVGLIERPFFCWDDGVVTNYKFYQIGVKP